MSHLRERLKMKNGTSTSAKLQSICIQMLLWMTLAATPISLLAVRPKEEHAKSLISSQKSEELQTNAPELIVPTGHLKSIVSLAFSPNGALLASIGWQEHVVKLWDVTTGQMLRTLTAREQQGHLAFSPDGNLLASGGSQGTI